MAMGTYNLATLRQLFDHEPVECFNSTTHSYTEGVHIIVTGALRRGSGSRIAAWTRLRRRCVIQLFDSFCGRHASRVSHLAPNLAA